MRPWIIVLSSTIIALAVATAIAVPELLNAPPSEIAAILLSHLPALAVVGLAVYALAATLMVTANLLAETMRARHELALGQGNRGITPGANGSHPTASWASRFAPKEARREIARSHYILLARSHVFSAAIALAGIIGLGLAQEHGSLPFSWGAVPIISAILVLVGVLLLTLLGRIAIDVTAEPLLAAVSQAPAHHEVSDSLRRAAEALEQACDVIRSDDRAPARLTQFPERLVTVLDQGNRALLDAVDRLSSNTQALETAIHSSVETIETTVLAAAAQPRPTDEPTASADPNSFAELQTAVVQLTDVLRGLVAAPAVSEGTALAAGPVPARHGPPPPRLAGELRKLLQEIDAD